MAVKPVVLIVRDGWGFNPNPRGNSVYAAQTPVMDRLKTRHPWTLLDASGEAVGLPEGYQGSSEVGHLNMGAGRVVIQELKRIDDGLTDGSLFKSPQWTRLVENWKGRKGAAFHFFGLLQDEGVHAHQEHLFKLVRRARLEHASGRIVVHPFLDGRDTPPRSSAEYIAKLEKVTGEIGNASVGTVMGRYYAMDRSKNWRLTDRAHAAIVSARADRAPDVMTVVEQSYAGDRTPDGGEMVDEYIPPHVVGDYAGVEEGDSILHTNYRQDRAIQLSQAFVDPGYPGVLAARPQVVYAGLTRYYDEFPFFLLGALGGEGGMDHLLGGVVADAGRRQLRLAETQKFRHVTSFFNGKSTTPFKGEDQVEIKGRFDPATFASHPEMEADRVTDELLGRLRGNPYGLIVVNYANGDMVGHTGVFTAARRAVEKVDDCLGRIVPPLLALDAEIIITADHGNAEQMVDYETGMIKTSHTLFPVECVHVSGDGWNEKLAAGGKLSDLAPTILELMGLPIPAAMTARSLLEK
ncbi:MAG: 2,3-bisphosphoglycerate-independent phosphoglycerate mutase [Planctomycetota bacterium]|nr:2,3-bisphosphoglycerate-independent phosphoglycerate mutase [Planctomycetota bacterium]